MKNYLIDELTFKKFVQKVKCSVDGDQVTAVIKQEHNDRWNSLKNFLCHFCTIYLFRETAEIRKNPERENPKRKRKIQPEKPTKPKAVKKRKAAPKSKPAEEPDEPTDFDEEQTRSESEPTNNFSKQSPVPSNSELSDWDNGF